MAAPCAIRGVGARASGGRATMGPVSGRDLMELEQILYWRWDPIGVNDAFPAATDEYGDYALELIHLLRSGAALETVADYLRVVEDEWIEVPTSHATRIDVAARVLLWHRRARRRADGRGPARSVM